MSELWKPIPGYDDLYEVSNFGNVRKVRFINKNTNKKIEPKPHTITKTKWGYVRTGLSKNGKSKFIFVHRLVLLAFVGAPPDGHECAHLDGKRDNNNLSNLKWTTKKENHSHKKIHGTHQAGEKQGMAKLTDKEVLKIRHLRGRGMTLLSIANKFNVSEQNVSHIVSRKAWKHI